MVEVIGWLGAVFYIGAYFLLSINKLRAERPFYHVLNALGALCLIINALAINDSPNFFINFIWMVIASVTVYRIVNYSRKQKA